MGEYFDWVNVNKREYICPGDFDYGNKFHESLHKNNSVLRGLYELLSRRWKGDPVVFLGDEAEISKDTPYGLLRDLLAQAGTNHYHDFICENYRNVSYLFRDAEKEVREGISNYIYDIKDRDLKLSISSKLDELIQSYENKSVDIDEILDFYVRFEKIHPFEDYNGRVGRLLMIKEWKTRFTCLKIT